MRSELHLETHLDIYSPSIGVGNYVCNKVCDVPGDGPESFPGHSAVITLTANRSRTMGRG